MNTGNSPLRERLFLLDNIKGILIILVVLGHLLAIDDSWGRNIYNVTHFLIYAVHMPMFIMISGLFSKGDYGFRQFVKGCLIPYVTFDLLYSLFDALGGGQIDLNILIARNGYWYILCIGIMRLLYTRIKPAYIILAVSVALSVASVFISEDIWRILSLGRVFLLYPVFYLGTRLSPGKIREARRHVPLCVMIGLAVIAAECLMYFNGIVTTGTHNQPTSITHLLIKYLFMLVFTPAAFVFMAALVPDRRIALVTQCGKNSIMIYLLHFFVVKVISFGIKKLGLPVNTGLFFGLVALSVLISWALSREPILKAYRAYVGKVMSILHLAG